MPPIRQKQIISLHLEGLQNVSQKLERLQESIKNAIHKGELWLQETFEGHTFAQINQLLLEENSQCVQICLDIASEKDDVTEDKFKAGTQGPTSTEELRNQDAAKSHVEKSHHYELSTQFLTMKLSTQTSEEKFTQLNEKVESLISETEKLSKKNKFLLNKNKEHEKFIQEIAEKQSTAETVNSFKYQEIMNELHQASQFIKFETESLTEKIFQCEQRNENIMKKYEDLETRNEVNFERLIQLCKDDLKLATDNLSGQINEDKKMIDVMSEKLDETVHTLSKDFHQFREYIERISTSSCTKDSTIATLQKSVEDIEAKVLSSSIEVEKMSQEIGQTRYNNMAEGFCLTVGYMTPTFINKEEIIRLFRLADYKSIHYNKQTGIYTAPFDGVYIFSLMTTNLTDKEAVLCMYLKDKSDEEIPKAVCRMKHKNVSVSAVFPIALYKGEQLYIKSADDCVSLQLRCDSHYWCIFIKRF